MKKNNSLLLFFMLISVYGLAQNVYGALAIDKSNGTYYGWANDFASLISAEKRALKECSSKGGNCTIVLTWAGKGCAVYRTVSKNAGTAYGWGVGATQAEADAIATAEALKRSKGVVPSEFVWACNTVGDFKKIDSESENSTINTKTISTNSTKGKLYGLKDRNGNVYDYEGEINGKLPHGKGIATFKKGDIFTGSFLNGKIEGKGTMIFKSGTRYDGDFKNDDCEGHGIMVYSSGAKYVGDYVNGKREGKGIYRFPDGSVYEGELKNGNRHGYGVQTDPDGKIVHKGQWANHEPVN
jgi:hypothetical protein